jgi:signal transduction histidine kinase
MADPVTAGSVKRMSDAPARPGSRSWAWLGALPAWTWDVAPALLAAAILVPGLGRGALPIAVGLVAAAALLARRRLPLTVLAVTGTAAFAGISLREAAAGSTAVAVIVALYTVDTRCGRRWSLAASAVALGGALLAMGLSTTVSAEQLAEIAIAPAAVIIALWVMGDNLRVRRAYVAGLEERAAWVDAQRAADARRAAEDERARIARELHDVVAHHVAVIAVQAGAARMLAPAGDERTRDLLQSIEGSSHEAMSELRRLLGVLRREPGEEPAGEQAGGRPPPPAPQPGLGQLDQLIDQVRRAGLPVELTVIGAPGRLPDGVDLSAYRIVQEALTNALKHAGPVPTQVCLRCDGAAVTLIVTSRAPAAELPVADPSAAGPPGAAGPDRTGHGLIGMRERAAMAGGELRAGPTADGGFEVFARLPVEPGRAAVPLAQAAGDRR